jgi:hypothetical protein
MILSNKKRIVQDGFTLPIVLIFVLAFLAAPLVFWYTNSRSVTQPSVQGAQSTNSKEGTHIQVTSQNGAWDLVEYLCKTKDECTESLTSGKKWEAISGGVTSGSSIKINYSELWKDYQYLKVFVKPGWGTATKSYAVKNEFGATDAQVHSFGNDQALILPVSVVESGNYTFLLFTDSI